MSLTDNSPLQPTTLDLSGDRLLVDYTITGNAAHARAVAEQLVVEQTIEFPLELVPQDDIRAQIVAQAEPPVAIAPDRHQLRVSFASEIVGDQLPQLLNVLFGNLSLVPGVRVDDVHLPAALLDRFPGPRHGIPGLRERFGWHGKPLLATALKPMGTPLPTLADMAYELAMGGIQIVKDDHSFATQPFCDFRERVARIAAAVGHANHDGATTVYVPALNVPFQEIAAAAEYAVAAGAGGLLVLPGICGYDTMRWLAETTPAETVVVAHPAMLGSLVTDPASGMAHRLAFGMLTRLAGADVSVFPNSGGRFTFEPADCAAIAAGCREPLGALRPSWPAPAGGMSVDNATGIVDRYGPDVCLLIGGSLYRGDLRARAGQLRDAVAGREEEPRQ